MTRSLNLIPKTAEQNLVVRSCKSEATTNNKRLRSRYYSVEATAELHVWSSPARMHIKL